MTASLQHPLFILLRAIGSNSRPVHCCTDFWGKKGVPFTPLSLPPFCAAWVQHFQLRAGAVVEPPSPLEYPYTNTRRHPARETLKMRCRFGHDHSTQPVKATRYSRGRPSWEVPPFHCPGCPLTRPHNRKAKNWVTYKTMAKAKGAGHTRACRMCFPRGY